MYSKQDGKLSTIGKVLQFSGEITTEIEEDFRNLYYKRNPIYPIFYALMGIIVAVLGLLFLVAEEGFRDINLGMFLLLAALASFVVAFRLLHIWWRWWWPRFISIFGTHLFCEVTSSGIRFKTDAPEIN